MFLDVATKPVKSVTVKGKKSNSKGVSEFFQRPKVDTIFLSQVMRTKNDEDF